MALNSRHMREHIVVISTLTLRKVCAQYTDWHNLRFEREITLFFNRLLMIRSYLQVICLETSVLYEYSGCSHVVIVR